MNKIISLFAVFCIAIALLGCGGGGGGGSPVAPAADPAFDTVLEANLCRALWQRTAPKPRLKELILSCQKFPTAL